MFRALGWSLLLISACSTRHTGDQSAQTSSKQQGLVLPIDAGDSAAAIDAPLSGAPIAVSAPPVLLAETVPVSPEETPESRLATLRDHASVIAIVQCTGMTSQDTNDFPFVSTTFTLSLQQQIRGDAPATVTLQGGDTQTHHIHASDQPRLAVGNSYLVFFWPDHRFAAGRDVLVEALPMIGPTDFQIMGTTRSTSSIGGAAQ
jgi:hypothetical protein